MVNPCKATISMVIFNMIDGYYWAGGFQDWLALNVKIQQQNIGISKITTGYRMDLLFREWISYFEDGMFFMFFMVFMCYSISTKRMIPSR